MPKKVTIEDLARMVKRGFDNVDRRFESVDKRFESVDKRFDEVDQKFKLIFDDLALIRADIHDIKMVTGPLVQIAAAMGNEIKELKIRLERVERKVGLAR